MNQHNGQPRVLAVGEEPPPMDGETPKPTKPRKQARAKGTAGRFECINAFVDATLQTLTPAETAVWLILWRDTKPTGLAQTNQTSLAKRAGVSERAVRKALTRMKGKGLLQIVKRGGMRQGASIYRVHPTAKTD